MSTDPRAPIGIFDSGIGGLTVVKEVMTTLPNEHILYFGDTARVPYGIKSVETVRKYALQIIDFLLSHNVKMILTACNTVSAAAEKEVVKYCKSYNVPVLDVIEAGTHSAIQMIDGHKNIGVIGTLATINSQTYEKALNKLAIDLEIVSVPCPLLVPLAEEGWTDNEIAYKTLETYLGKFIIQKPDALILGCTHYPLFKDAIQKVLDSPETKIIDSAISIASIAREKLTEMNLLNPSGPGKFECYVSDKPQRFQELAERFLGEPIADPKITVLE